MPNNEEYEGEKKKSNDLSKLLIIPRRPPMNIDQICETIKNLARLIGFKHIHYDSLDKENQGKV